jgi:hypothetical protein
MSAKLSAPGWYRAGLYLLIGLAFSYALSIGARAGLGYDPVLDGEDRKSTRLNSSHNR